MIEKEFLNGEEKKEQESKGYICIPEADLPPMEDDFLANFSKRISRITAELVAGFQFVRGLKNAVSIFGSSRAQPGTSHYEEARKLAYSLAKEGRPIVTGGGPGIMEAANRGAYEAKGESIGINIKLPQWQWVNKYVTNSIAMRYFFTRKVMFSFAAKVYVFFPGGYGTLDEFFEMVTLVQTKKLVRKVLIIAVGKEYWNSLFAWIKQDAHIKYKAVKKEELDIVRIVDSAEQALRLIQKFSKNNI
ncbi:MAG: hypothetical protein UY15_C0018G0005 [Parcubacteria group bacterium GW2011_GWA2_47_9]|nr:MAG: hypothetical protein UY15_C0018G0005 [Parcubacteria group bacterium GW2011_GWA2_47_9]